MCSYGRASFWSLGTGYLPCLNMFTCSKGVKLYNINHCKDLICTVKCFTGWKLAKKAFRVKQRNTFNHC